MHCSKRVLIAIKGVALWATRRGLWPRQSLQHEDHIPMRFCVVSCAAVHLNHMHAVVTHKTNSGLASVCMQRACTEDPASSACGFAFTCDMMRLAGSCLQFPVPLLCFRPIGIAPAQMHLRRMLRSSSVTRTCTFSGNTRSSMRCVYCLPQDHGNRKGRAMAAHTSQKKQQASGLFDIAGSWACYGGKYLPYHPLL